MNRIRRWPSLLAILGALVFAPPAHSQYGVVNPYANPYAVAPYAGAGGYLAGSAQVIQAQGDQAIQMEQARVEREKANQAKIDTKKQAFNEMMYEQANTPTQVEKTTLVINQIALRMMQSPQPAEISGGKTLNTFMPYISALSAKGIMGPPVPLNQDLLKRINCSAGVDGPNVTMLQPSQTLNWPLALEGKLVDETTGLITQAVNQVMTTRLDLKVYQKLLSNIGDIRANVVDLTFKKEELDTGAYLDACHFLDLLEQAVKGLPRAGAKEALLGSNGVYGQNVPELVFNMTSRGLTFAPSLPGDASAYQMLHNAFVGYIMSAQTNSGYQPQLRVQMPTSASAPSPTLNH